MNQRLKYLIPLIVFLVLAVFLFVGLYLNPRDVPSGMIGKPAPEFTLPRLGSNDTLSKKDLLGKVYLVNVWASWCEACRYEHPYYVDLKRSGEKTFLLGFNYRDKTYLAQRWLRELGDPYDACVVDEKGKVAIDFGVTGAPETYIIDKKGVIRDQVIGAVTPEVWKKKVKPLLQKLEAE